MIISTDLYIPFPRPLVFATYRDKLIELIPYMPNVRSIEVKSRHQEKALVNCVNQWYGGGDIPTGLRTLLSKDMLKWTEYNTWNESEFTLVWSIKTHAFTEAVHCVGKNRFLSNGEGTSIESRGELKINPHKIGGVPQLLKNRVAGVVEDFLNKKIEPNLLQMRDGVQRYLESKTAQSKSA
ncbi:hypothetical protein [Lyngbya aestuarii]|uniref:hypothetical protein n=1 Tax=Lyngbya aestuarii TaxID=118322 RepID=UPI00403D9E3A